MSGHSKWHNIRVRKMASDAKRGKVYTRHSKLIQIAAQGGGDPVTNSALRAAIENAKMDDVPNANIERAIKKGSGELKGEQMQEVLYAAMSHGVALLIECLTDNKQRTFSHTQSVVTKHGGKWAETASVLFLFNRLGVVTAVGTLTDEVELALMDAGAEEIERGEEHHLTVTSAAHHWTKVRDALVKAGLKVESAGLRYVASQKVEASAADAEAVMSLVELLEEDDDVSEVHTNLA